jgi:hypothetical protein
MVEIRAVVETTALAWRAHSPSNQEHQVGRTILATAQPWQQHARSRTGLTRAQRRRQRPEVLADNHGTEDDLEHFLASAGVNDHYGAGLPELARWSQFGDQHYRPQDLDHVADELACAQASTHDPEQVSALVEAAHIVQQCRANGWHLHVLVD